LLAYFDGDRQRVLDCVGQIAAIADDDGLVFHRREARDETIREDDVDAGVRVTMPARLGTARIKLVLNVNFGDP
jgi:hypothetical protein